MIFDRCLIFVALFFVLATNHALAQEDNSLDVESAEIEAYSGFYELNELEVLSTNYVYFIFKSLKSPEPFVAALEERFGLGVEKKGNSVKWIEISQPAWSVGKLNVDLQVFTVESFEDPKEWYDVEIKVETTKGKNLLQPGTKSHRAIKQFLQDTVTEALVEQESN